MVLLCFYLQSESITSVCSSNKTDHDAATWLRASLTSVPTEQTNIPPAPVWSVMLEENFFFFLLEVNKVKHLPLFCQENYGATSRQDCTGMDRFSLQHNPFYKTLCKGFFQNKRYYKTEHLNIHISLSKKAPSWRKEKAL